MKIGMIVAVGPSGVIGVDGRIPWSKKVDMRRFKQRTMGGNLLMGRKTWESINRPLEGRRIMILSRSPHTLVPEITVRVGEEVIDALKVYASIEEALRDTDDRPTWVAGGEEIYNQALPYVDTIDLTLVSDAPREGELVNHQVTVLSSYLEGFSGFKLTGERVNPEDATLTHRTYERI